MADKDFTQNAENFTGECLSSASPSLTWAGLNSIYHPLEEGRGCLSQHFYLCPSLPLSDVFLGEAVPVGNDFTLVELYQWDEGRLSANNGHSHLTTSYSESQGYFLRCCCCCSMTMEIHFTKINQNCNRGTRKAKSWCFHKPTFPSVGRWRPQM